jgi:PAS domain S-box-containing protein
MLLLGTGTVFLLCCYLIKTQSGSPRLQWIFQHPLAQMMSLSVLACGWSVLGSVGFAYQFGYSFLAYFLGMAAVFMLTPLMLLPLQRLCQLYQLRSLADLFAYRYDHNLAGLLATLAITLGVIPLLAMQMQALQQVLSYLLNQQIAHWAFGLHLIALLVYLLPSFKIGCHDTQHNANKTSSLRNLLAILGGMKLFGFIAMAVIATSLAFGNYAGLSQWLQQQPQALNMLYGTATNSPWRSLILAFFVAVLAMPHVFELLFTQAQESAKKSATQLYQAAWTVPLYLWLLALCVPFILWAGIKLDSSTTAEYFTVGIGLTTQHISVQMLALWLVLCATTAVLLAAPIGCGKIIVNFMVLPNVQQWSHPHLWQRLHQWRSFAAIAVLLMATCFYRLLDHSRDLSELMLLAFIGTLQLLPGIIGVIFWSAASVWGLVVGLCVGLAVWMSTLVLPLFAYTEPALVPWFDLGFTPGIENWQLPALIAICLNTAFFIFISLISTQSEAAKEAAVNCSLPQMRRSYRQRLPVNTIAELTCALNQIFDANIADNLTASALHTLGLPAQQASPYALRRLREQIQMRLTSEMGPLLARRLMDCCLPFASAASQLRTLDTQLIEQRLDGYGEHLSGLAAELDQLRRLYRETLKQLPVGVVSLSQDGEILSWNNAMESLTGLAAPTLLGGDIQRLPSPWRELLSNTPKAKGQRTQEVLVHHHKLWLQLHWIDIYAKTPPYEQLGRMLSIEDFTQTKQLEASLTHSERLAAIGRLAAGVAHEIGNPVTAIACLAQELPYLEIDAANSHSQLKEFSQPILQQTQRITQIVDALTHFSYSSEQTAQSHEPIDVHAVITAALELAALTSRSRQHVIDNACPPEQWTLGNAQRLQQVFLNLINNACDASPPGSRIAIDYQADVDYIILKVRDHGCGISADLLTKVFHPFVTSKPVGQGTGLGLYLADGIIKEHDGSIRILSPRADGCVGTEVIVRLPRALTSSAR